MVALNAFYEKIAFVFDFGFAARGSSTTVPMATMATIANSIVLTRCYPEC
jgi:L-cystine uptake protein TcyP (sodium:dicarboxylate symporter family)